jgi:hypothetical protein
MGIGKNAKVMAKIGDQVAARSLLMPAYNWLLSKIMMIAKSEILFNE